MKLWRFFKTILSTVYEIFKDPVDHTCSMKAERKYIINWQFMTDNSCKSKKDGVTKNDQISWNYTHIYLYCYAENFETWVHWKIKS